jgi:hypothetical protein
MLVDYLLNRGREQGIEQGIERGIEMTKLEVASKLLASGLDWSSIVNFTGVTQEKFEAWFATRNQQ